MKALRNRDITTALFEQKRTKNNANGTNLTIRMLENLTQPSLKSTLLAVKFTIR